MTHGFPNMFFIGYIQGGLNGSVTEVFGRQGEHSAWIIAEALNRGAKAVEPSQAGMDAYCRLFKEIEVDTSAFRAECTPSYFSNEGQKDAPWQLFRAYGHGWDAFMKLLSDWRADRMMASVRQRQSSGAPTDGRVSTGMVRQSAAPVGCGSYQVLGETG